MLYLPYAERQSITIIKLVSGVKRSGIPDKIRSNEAAGITRG